MQPKRQIINIINFVRDIEPRDPSITRERLADTVREQIALSGRLGLKTTFLLQYDALIDPVYQEMFRELDPRQYELGLWHEIVQPQCEKLGIAWTGRYPWDWHCHCGFPVGYTREQRRALLDLSFGTFREVFGYYPRVFGSWFFDSESLRYITDKYGLDACCNCKEQYGTDGYTLWGGYYGQAYYPSRTNIFVPAQTEAQHLDVPLFRMLGADPVYQYDCGLSVEEGVSFQKDVVTLEATDSYPEKGGSVPGWVDWFMQENFNGRCLSFGYAQAGQENSFLWERIRDGLNYQLPLFAKLQSEGKLEVETLGETGRWFKRTFPHTPASTIAAHSAYGDDAKNSLWYCSRHYRINLYRDGDTLRIRDLHIFRETMVDPYENRVCTTNDATYETLPVADGNLFSGNGVLSGVYIRKADGAAVRGEQMAFSDLGGGTARVQFGELAFTLREDGLDVEAPWDFVLENRIGRPDSTHLPRLVSCSDDSLALTYKDTAYGLTLVQGRFASSVAVQSECGRVRVRIMNR